MAEPGSWRDFVHQFVKTHALLFTQTKQSLTHSTLFTHRLQTLLHLSLFGDHVQDTMTSEQRGSVDQDSDTRRKEARVSMTLARRVGWGHQADPHNNNHI